MLDAIITLVNIVDKVLDTYNTNERWLVKKMRSKYANRIVVILPIKEKEACITTTRKKGVLQLALQPNF
jgi:hypothetical protein